MGIISKNDRSRNIERLETNRKYSNTWWNEYGKLSTFFSFTERIHALTIRGLIKKLPIAKRKILLEFGFGSGFLIKRLAQQQTAELLVGCDISVSNTIKLRQNCRLQGIDNVIGLPISPYSTSLALKDSVADLVICSHVIEHVADDISFINEMHRILKPNGHAIIMLPINEEQLDVPTHLRKYTVAQVKDLFCEKFSIQNIGTNDVFSHWIRTVGLCNCSLNWLMKKVLIFILSLFPLRALLKVDKMLMFLSFRPSEVFFIAQKR
ncbi:MAG: class I SAM-dependent methyltransferase [Fibrobacteres bacterium]|nr:class I SAM-dependent methyltransferase [Fibrobacterota bacterium]